MTEAELLAAFRQVDGIITGDHVVYTSGRHGNAYVNKDALYPDPILIEQVCWEMAQRLPPETEMIIGPAVGAVILSTWVARHMCARHDVRQMVHSVYADKEADGFVLKRGYDKLVAGRRCAVVEDIVTTGGSVHKVLEATRACGGIVDQVVAICNRGAITAELLGVARFDALLTIKLDSWSEAECPMCRDGVPINTTVGKGREYLARKGQG